ncbi:MAG: GatB/YqeY domain-containing protein [Alphaproteobacteria bacterium]|nr:GatB/YqeY domain-containing protein [Alphaproteobacteria bacterium]
MISALKEKDRVNMAELGKAELSDSEILQMLQTMFKQRGESIKAYQHVLIWWRRRRLRW